MKFLTLTATLLLDFSCILHFTSASPNGALHPISIPLQRKRYVYNSDGIFNLTAALKAHSRTVKKFKWGLQQLIFNQIARHQGLILGRIAAKYHNTAARHQQKKQTVDQLKGEVASLGGSILGRLLKRQAEPLTNQGNQMWTGIIGVGSPEQEFIIDFDTGSADLWIPSSNCKSDACASKNRYDASASISSSMQEEPFKISYGDGTSISGFKYNDCVSVAGLQIFNQTFSSASYLSSSMGEDPTDGILGLAYPSISHLNAPSILENAHAQGLIPSTTFSFSLSDEGSEIFLGGVDKSKYSGLIEYHAVTQKAYWQIGSASCYVNGRKISRAKYETVIDSGTTIMYGPKDVVTEIYGQVAGSSPVAEAEGLWKFPCSNTPIVAFTWSGGRQWKISPERMILGKSETNDSLCIGAISGQSVGLDEDTWLLGDSFMTNVYSVFNPTLNTIGFANPRSQFVLNFDLL